MGWLAGIISSGAAALIVAGAVLIFLPHYRRLPGATHPWICRALIAIMFMAGSALTISSIGHWMTGIITDVAGWFGGTNLGPAHVLITLAALALLLTCVVGFIWAPNDAIATTALLLPLVLSLPAGGVLHHIYVATTAPAQQVVNQISAWLGG